MKLFTKLALTLFVFPLVMHSQESEDQIGNSLDTKKSKKVDHSAQVKAKMLYSEKAKYVVYNYSMKDGSNTLSDGKIYRKFSDNGIHERFYINGKDETIRFAYFSDPSALVTSNINKSEYCTYRDEFSVLYPFMMRGMVKNYEVEKS